MEELRTEVLIVGAGPVGLAMALLLEKLGIDCMIVERREGLHDAPQAHVISSRSLEICRALGIDDATIRSAGPDPADTLNVRWVDRLVGRDLGVFSLASDPDAVARMIAQTPTPVCNLSQDRFERILFEHLSPDTRVRFHHKWIGFEKTDEGYRSLLALGDGDDSVAIRSAFIVGADGAGSRVRASIGAAMEGPTRIQSYVTVHFGADLRDSLGDRSGLLFWVMDADYAGVFIAHDIDGNWIFMKEVDANEPLDVIDEEKFARLLRGAIGTDVDLTIHSMNAWVMTAQLADAYQQEGVFLVGDAAHRFPPTGGIGMNTGFGDAYNLAWKIAMVHRGFNRDLLLSYEPERRPVAAANSEQSFLNARKMSEVGQALDVGGDGLISMADLEAVLADPARQAEVQAAIDHQAAHFDMSGLDLGVCYRSNAIVSDGPPPVSDRPTLEYVPSTTPGSRLPHAWLESGGERVSTLDLVRYDRFLVLSFGAIPDLEQAVEDLVAAGFPVELIHIGGATGLQPVDEAFAELFSADEVLLVRPDGHIGARLSARNAEQQLHETLRRLIPLEQEPD